jgi:hypothetical protein
MNKIIFICSLYSYSVYSNYLVFIFRMEHMHTQVFEEPTVLKKCIVSSLCKAISGNSDLLAEGICGLPFRRDKSLLGSSSNA